MELNKAMNQVTLLFLIMLIGYITGKRGMTNKEVNRGLTELILNITLPAMIIASFNFSFSKDMLLKALVMLLVSIFLYLTLIFSSKLFYHMYADGIKSVLRFTAIFSNCAFMGYPVIESIYGKIGIFYAAIFNIPFNILIWTVGIMLFTKDKSSTKREIINPGIVSVFIGIIIFTFSIKLPAPILNTFSTIGSTTTPLSMIIVGSMLSTLRVKDVFCGSHVYYGSLVRLLLIPFSVLVLLKGIGLNDMFVGIPVLTMAMPAAVNTSIISERYGGDSSLASRCVFLTTVFSAITIPLIMYFL